jgi:hypothetical protein
VSHPGGEEPDFILVSSSRNAWSRQLPESDAQRTVAAKRRGEDNLRLSGLGYTILRPGRVDNLANVSSSVFKARWQSYPTRCSCSCYLCGLVSCFLRSSLLGCGSELMFVSPCAAAVLFPVAFEVLSSQQQLWRSSDLLVTMTSKLLVCLLLPFRPAG